MFTLFNILFGVDREIALNIIELSSNKKLKQYIENFSRYVYSTANIVISLMSITITIIPSQSLTHPLKSLPSQ